jgi:hypothetical protein
MNAAGPPGLVLSIQTRLKNEARQTNRPFAELLELFAVERFLHRLGRSGHRDRFVLKGALLLRNWLHTDTRPTRDIDLLGDLDIDEGQLHARLRDILQTGVEDDGIDFDLDSIEVRAIRAESPVLGLRAKFDARLGRMRLRYQVDVGLGDAVFPPAEDVVAGGLLGFPMASVRAYTPYTALAEKIEAMAVLGEANSRTKDYHDLAILSRSLGFDGTVLAESVRRTFARRSTRIPPEPLAGLSEAFAEDPLHAGRWRAFLGKGAMPADQPDFRLAVAAIRRFVQPVVDAARVEGGTPGHWPPGGPWQ